LLQRLIATSLMNTYIQNAAVSLLTAAAILMQHAAQSKLLIVVFYIIFPIHKTLTFRVDINFFKQ